MSTIINTLKYLDINIGEKHYFGSEGADMKIISTAEEFTITSKKENNEYDEFNLTINFTDENDGELTVQDKEKLKQYKIKQFIIYTSNLGNDSEGIDRNINYKNVKTPEFMVNDQKVIIKNFKYTNHGTYSPYTNGGGILWNGEYIFTLNETIILQDPLNITFELNAVVGGAGNESFNFGIVFETIISSQEKLEKLFEYNQINNKVNKLMAKRDLLIDKDATNQTIKKARQLIKKKIEFHKYWIDKLYNITFYTHLILVLLLFIMLFYKLL